MARGTPISAQKRKSATARRRATEARDLPHAGALAIPDVVDFQASWAAYNLNNFRCLEHGAPQPKVKNCRYNPLCVHRLGLEKWEKLMKAQNSDAAPQEDYTPRNASSQPCGLVNVGNSCYVNSFLQICFNDLTIRQCVFDWRPDENFVKSDLTRMDIQAVMNCLQELFVTMQITPYEDASAQKLVELLQLDNEQHDALEFTMLFFDALDRNLAYHSNGENIRRVIRKCYEGRVQETISCECGKRRSNSVTMLRSLQLAIIGFKSLTQAIEKYFTPEVLTDYRCDICGNVGTTTKVCEVVELPPVLMVSLNRYSFDNQGRNKKVTSPLQFPKTLDTKKFSSSSSGGAWQYELSAVMIHEGPNTDCGHYYDVIKDPISGHWFTYNDKDVKETKCPGCSVEKESISRATAEMRGCYALIYRKIENESDGDVQEPQLPPSEIVDEIRNKLNLQFSRDRNEGSQSLSVWNETVKARHTWISELWEQLEVPDGMAAMQSPEKYVFLPTALLREIQSAERKSVEVMKDVGIQVVDENTLRSVIYPIESLPDTHIQLCSHGKLSLHAVINGDAKLVQRLPAEALLRRYNIGLKHTRRYVAQAEAKENCFEYYGDVESNGGLQSLCNGNDVCVECVKHFKYEGSFKDRLDGTCALVQSILRNKFRLHDFTQVPKPPEYQPPDDAVWVSKRHLMSFKKMALQEMEYVKNLNREEALQLNFTTNGSPFKGLDENQEEQPTQKFLTEDYFEVQPIRCNRKVVVSDTRNSSLNRARNKRLEKTINQVVRNNAPSSTPAEDEFDITDGEGSETSESSDDESERKPSSESSDSEPERKYLKLEDQDPPKDMLSLVEPKFDRSPNHEPVHVAQNGFGNSNNHSTVPATASESSNSTRYEEMDVKAELCQNGNCTPSSETAESESTTNAAEREDVHRPSSSMSSMSKNNGNGMDIGNDNGGLALDQPVHFNSLLLCPHEKLTYSKTRLWVLAEEWNELITYFELYNTVPCSQPECDECVNDYFVGEANEQEENQKIVDIFRRIGPFLRNADKRKLKTRDMGIYTKAICSNFLANMRAAQRGKGKFPLPTICQNCILCAHDRPYLALDESVHCGLARPVAITSEEWDTVVNLFTTYLPGNVADFVEISLNEDEPNNVCNECADEKHRLDDLKRFEYLEGAEIYVKLKGDEPDDSASSMNIKTATTRRALAKNLIKVKLKSTDTVMALKLQLYQKLKQTPADQLIYHGENLLDDNMTLAEARIDPNNVENPLILIVQTETVPSTSTSDVPRPLERGFRDTALATLH